MRIPPLLPLVTAFAVVLPLAPAQDEEEGPTLAEARAEFEKADAALNRAWGETKAALPDWRFEWLLEEQKEWLQFRDDRAESDAFFSGGQQFEGREKESPDYWSSLAWSTQTRTEMILAWKTAEEAGETPWSGLWTDGYGGWLVIEEAGDPRKVGFRIHVVRGPTYHMGGISGTAKRNGEAGFFSDEGDPDYHFGEDGTETWLYFEKDPAAPRVEVKGIHTQPYHGARAYFDGVYTRLREPTEEDLEMFEEP